MDTTAPRIGVFFCACGETIMDLIHYETLMEFARAQDGVEHVGKCTLLCSPEGRKLISEEIKGHKLDRVVIAACSPRMYLEEFREAARKGGINPYMVEQANLRDQVAWIHSLDAPAATAKAKDQLHMSIERSRKMTPSDFGPTAVVDEEQCSGCGICATTCRAGSISFVDTGDGHRVAKVDRGECKACGACVAACPSGALNLEGFTNEEIVAQINAFSKGLLDSKEPSPAVLVFACHWCSYPAADLAGLKRMQMDVNFRMIRTPCSARVDPEWVMQALSRGVDGVLILGGKEGSCHYQGGNVKTRNRMVILSKVIEQLGFDPERFSLEWVNADEPYRFSSLIDNFVDKIRELGPNPTRAPEEEEQMTSALHHGRDEITRSTSR
ncbi:MAG: hydrogenase iron-sulfur subunit [Methanomassiliicoccus sp.]|nr:hydrogenase iron-sulfur subunit [Methanomassiliicoccus sp.]